MRKLSFKLLTLATVFASAFLAPAQTADNESTLKQIAGYRLWTRVNEQPVVVQQPAVVSATGSIAVSDIGVTAI
jgi:hypothetical protein